MEISNSCGVSHDNSVDIYSYNHNRWYLFFRISLWSGTNL